MENLMAKLTALLAFALVLALSSFAAADCKSFVKDGYPLGIRPLAPNVTLDLATADAANASFTVYIEGDAVGGNLAGCTVKLSIASVNGSGAQLYVAPDKLETGLGWKDAQAYLVGIATEPFDNVIASIRIADADNANNFVLLPALVSIRYRPTAVPTERPQPTSQATISVPTVSQPASPSFGPGGTLQEIGRELEQDASRYIVAAGAVLFLGLLLWVGLKTLAKD
ncbi:MAG: hypothetical protein V1708_00275 [Candidatus Micrarchaeota archaeon]